MSIAILYESDEWSNLYLRDRLLDKGLEILFFDIEHEAPDPARFAGVDLILNRLYPSAYFRGNERSYFQGLALVEQLSELGIPMINSFTAMRYDFSKDLVCTALAAHWIPTPRVYCRSRDFSRSAIRYPCIVKPDCGGRTSWAHVVHDEQALLQLKETLPPVEFIFQQFIPSITPWTIRVEAINGRVFSAIRRSIDASGISGMARGSAFEKVEDLDPRIGDLVLHTLEVLDMRMGAIDMVIGEAGPFIIDVNATPNYSKQVIQLLGKNPMDTVADFIHGEYQKIIANKVLAP